MKTPFSFILLFTTPLFAGETPLSGNAGDFMTPSAKDVIPAGKVSGSWKLRSGIAWRKIGKTSIDPGFQSSGAYASNFFSPNPASGPLGQNADRNYDNGFVKIGAATPGTGLTTNWEYTNPGQAAGGTLDYTLDGGIALSFPTSGQESEDIEAAPYLELAYLRPINDSLDLGFVTNFFFTDLDSNIQNQIDQFSVTTTDRFNTGGIILPAAPYTGTFTGPGPLLPNQPDDRSHTQTLTGAQTFLFESDIELYSLGFGSELLWHPSDQSYLTFGAGLVVNIANWEASTSVPLINPATVTVSNASYRDSDDEILLGLYLKLGAGYQLSEHWNVEGFFRYDWSEDLEGSVGPTTFDVDLSGWSLGAGVGYSF